MAGGYSTAVATTVSGDAAEMGREVLEKLQLRGVAKVDFKRDPAGRLWLLEVNPRFNLWHRVGAVAGVNIPAVVWADTMGLPRPSPMKATPGIKWCDAISDWPAAQASGMSVSAWLRWLGSCESFSDLDFTDPMPVAAKLAAVARDQARHLLPAGRRR